jgi:hypothetical protein
MLLVEKRTVSDKTSLLSHQISGKMKRSKKQMCLRIASQLQVNPIWGLLGKLLVLLQVVGRECTLTL